MFLAISIIMPLFLVSVNGGPVRRTNQVRRGDLLDLQGESTTSIPSSDVITIEDPSSLANSMESAKLLDYETPSPFKFRFEHNDGQGTVQHREETGDESGIVRGSYGYRDPLGMYRHVSYIADLDGFHAVVRTNEPGVENKNSADVAIVAIAPPSAVIAEMEKYTQNSMIENN